MPLVLRSPELPRRRLHCAGARWLAQMISPAVTEPIRRHVLAKRYLCTVGHAYRKRLSAASARSLQLQGDLLPPEELTEFEQLPYFDEALALRRPDEAAKISGTSVPEVAHYRALLESLVQPKSDARPRRHSTSPARYRPKRLCCNVVSALPEQ